MHKRKSRRTKRMQRNAKAVSVVRIGCRIRSFAERQQLAEGAPLMRMPLCAVSSDSDSRARLYEYPEVQ